MAVRALNRTWDLQGSENLLPYVQAIGENSIVSVDGGKLLHVQKWGDAVNTIVREVRDGKLYAVSDPKHRALGTVSGSVTASRTLHGRRVGRDLKCSLSTLFQDIR
ncbi:unnamed protein product [Lampetra fluviatilis]